MAEREARTAGARKAAQAAEAAAAEKVKLYQSVLKQERAKVYSEQEAARKKVLDERAARLKEARGKAATEVAAGKERVGMELEAARREVEASTGQLAAEIARRVLQISPRQGGPAGAVR
jgi:F-type H+-transporting ATPase subunit b